jgi:hypothetical protein
MKEAARVNGGRARRPWPKHETRESGARCDGRREARREASVKADGVRREAR